METKRIKVLFIDDDTLLGHIVLTDLQEEGYDALYQTSLAGVKACITESHPDIIVLDIEIGDSNGIDIAPELKALAPDTPILFTSSHTDGDTIAKALNVGVGYIKKPFEMTELRAYLQRYTHVSDSLHHISIGSLSLDTETHQLKQGTRVIRQLSDSEYKLLKLLAAYPNQTIGRKQLEQEVWPGGSSNEQSLNNFISKLRKYLSDDKQVELATVQKNGYQLNY